MSSANYREQSEAAKRLRRAVSLDNIQRILDRDPDVIREFAASVKDFCRDTPTRKTRLHALLAEACGEETLTVPIEELGLEEFGNKVQRQKFNDSHGQFRGRLHDHRQNIGEEEFELSLQHLRDGLVKYLACVETQRPPTSARKAAGRKRGGRDHAGEAARIGIFLRQKPDATQIEISGQIGVTARTLARDILKPGPIQNVWKAHLSNLEERKRESQTFDRQGEMSD